MPCFGGRAPVFRVLNRAFSAPSTWSVLAGIFAMFSRPPAIDISFAERTAPNTEVMFGATSTMILSVYFSAASRVPYSSKTVLQTSCNHSKSGDDISAPADFIADWDISPAFSCGIPSLVRASYVNDSRDPRF